MAQHSCGSPLYSHPSLGLAPHGSAPPIRVVAKLLVSGEEGGGEG